MPKPLAICIENLNARSRAARYLRCVALPGRQPGLRLDKSGRLLWQQEGAPACELWVSADERLMLYRQEGMAPVRLERAGRVLDAPFAKPVVLADQDQITIGWRRLRIHIHGEAPAVSPPAALPFSPRTARRLAQAAVTTAFIGGSLTAGGCEAIQVLLNPPAIQTVVVDVSTPTVEVREMPPVVETVEVTEPSPTIEIRETPPEVALPPIESTDIQSISEHIQGEWMAAQVYETAGERTWYTGTLTIAGDTYTFTPLGEVTGTSVEGALDFLFAHPSGEVAIEYASGVAADDPFAGFVPGDMLATCRFRADGEASEVFAIRVRDAAHLELYQPESESGLWKVVKHVGGSAAP